MMISNKKEQCRERKSLNKDTNSRNLEGESSIGSKNSLKQRSFDNYTDKIKEPQETRVHIVEYVTLIKKGLDTCPTCYITLKEKKCYLKIYENKKKKKVEGKLIVNLFYCEDCQCYFINQDHVQQLMDHGYNGRYKMKHLSSREKKTKVEKTTKEKSKISNNSVVKQGIKSCSNCLIQRQQECVGRKEICDYYRPCPTYNIPKHWPKEMVFNRNRFD